MIETNAIFLFNDFNVEIIHAAHAQVDTEWIKIPDTTNTTHEPILLDGQEAETNSTSIQPSSPSLPLAAMCDGRNETHYLLPLAEHMPALTVLCTVVMGQVPAVSQRKEIPSETMISFAVYDSNTIMASIKDKLVFNVQFLCYKQMSLLWYLSFRYFIFLFQ